MQQKNLIVAIVIGLAFANNVQINGTPNLVVMNAIDANGQIKASFIGYTTDASNIESVQSLKGASKYHTVKDLLVGVKRFMDTNTVSMESVQYVGNHYQTVQSLFQQLVNANLIDKPQVPKSNLIDVAHLVTATSGQNVTTSSYAHNHNIPFESKGKQPTIVERVELEGAVYAQIINEQKRQSTAMRKPTGSPQAATA